MEALNLAGVENGRHVKGSLFRDYVRMIKKHKHIDWSRHLPPSDMEYINHGIVTVVEWYPYDTFRNMGEAIFKELAHGDPEAARLWGRNTMDSLAGLYRNNLVVSGDQFRTLKKFIDMQGYFFDFGGFYLSVLGEDHIEIKIDKAFGSRGVQGYNFQMLGSFQRLLELSGATDVKAKFLKKAWEGAPNSVIELRWS